jgi:hypothetical protein
MNVCLSTSSKNEKHIIEWINYYIKIGIDYFIIYDDLSDISVEETLIENNIDSSIYTVFRNTSTDNLYIDLSQRYIVHKAYHPETWKELIVPKLIEKNIDYVLYVDLDEFLYINEYENIQELITHYLPFDVLKINWLFFGSNDLIKNDGLNNIIDLFTKSSNILCSDSGALKSITNVRNISLDHDVFQYGPHTLPIIKNSIVKDIENNIISSYGNNLNHSTPPLNDNNYINKIYIAHYSCQDLNQFVRRKFSNKTNYYWWINVLNCDTRENVYHYIDNINNNFNEFVLYLYDKINNNASEERNIFNIPAAYINKMIYLYNVFNKNDVYNYDVLNYKYSKNKNFMKK